MSTIDVRSHAFNVGIAIDYSPSVALFIGHLAYWAEKNLSNNINIHDGYVWSYDKLDAIAEQFPYFTKRQVETMINNCVDSGLVIKGNYNKTKYDRTNWYALTPAAFDYFPHLSSEKYVERLFLSISQKCEMEITEWGNRFTHYVPPIPDTIPDTDPKELKDIPDFKKSGKQKIKDYKKDERFMRFYEAYPKKVEPQAAFQQFLITVGNDDELLERIILDIEERKKRHSQWKDVQFIKAPARYLKSKEFDGEIINYQEEQEKKSKQANIDHQKRLKAQEEQSKKAFERERKEASDIQQDAVAFRKIKRELNSGDKQGLKSLRDLVGLKS